MLLLMQGKLPSSMSASRRDIQNPAPPERRRHIQVDDGVPILHEKICVGGIGVSGISKQDEPVAQAVADAL